MAFVNDVIDYGADLFGCTRAEVMGRSRMSYIIMARHAIWLAFKRRGLSSAHIASKMDRESSSVRHGQRHALELEKRLPDYALAIKLITEYKPAYAKELDI